jgi:hypothetical protein
MLQKDYVTLSFISTLLTDSSDVVAQRELRVRGPIVKRNHYSLSFQRTRVESFYIKVREAIIHWNKTIYFIAKLSRGLIRLLVYLICLVLIK